MSHLKRRISFILGATFGVAVVLTIAVIVIFNLINISALIPGSLTKTSPAPTATDLGLREKFGRLLSLAKAQAGGKIDVSWQQEQCRNLTFTYGNGSSLAQNGWSADSISTGPSQWKVTYSVNGAPTYAERWRAGFGPHSYTSTFSSESGPSIFGPRIVSSNGACGSTVAFHATDMNFASTGDYGALLVGVGVIGSTRMISWEILVNSKPTNWTVCGTTNVSQLDSTCP